MIDFEKKKMLPLTKKELKSHQEATQYYSCKKILVKMFPKDKNNRKVRDHCHYTDKYRDAAHSICKLIFNVPSEIPVVFYNSSNCDYHFIIKKLAKEREGQFECLGENTEKYKNFSVSIKKKLKNLIKIVMKIL